MFDWFSNSFDSTQSWIFLHLLQPLLYQLGWIGYDEQVFDAIAIFMYGVIQVTLVYLIVRPLEMLAPVEKWDDRKAVRVDIIYTLLTRLGLLPLVFFFLLTPLTAAGEEWLRLHGHIPHSLEDFLPSLAGQPLLSFICYLLLLDFAEYWRHRWQHRFEVWWALHSLHHSQQKMTLWTDDRNHVLDDLVAWLWFAAIAAIIGVPPGQYVALVIVGRAVESLAHANVRFGFGGLGDRLLVSPRFHRVHHAIGIGHEGKKYGVNFAVLFPIWDIVFRTADLSKAFPATGVRDQLQGRDYGEGFFRQQWFGVQRLLQSLKGN